MKSGIASREFQEGRTQQRELVKHEGRSFWTAFWVAMSGGLIGIVAGVGLWFTAGITYFWMACGIPTAGFVLFCVGLIRFTSKDKEDRASGLGILKGTFAGTFASIAIVVVTCLSISAWERQAAARAAAEHDREEKRRASEYAKEANAQRVKDAAEAAQRRSEEAIANAKREEEYARMRAAAAKEQAAEDNVEAARRADNDARRAELQRAFEARQAKTNGEEQARVKEIERQRDETTVKTTEQRAGLVKELAAARVTLGELNNKFPPLSAAVRVGQNEVTYAQKRLTELQTFKPRPDNYDVLARKYESDRDSGQARSVKAQNEISGIKSQIATLEARIQDLQKQIDNIDGK